MTVPQSPLRKNLHFCSWSGGKDAALAYYRIQDRGAQITRLITMMTESGERSRSHGLRGDVLQAQAERMGVSTVFVPSSWDTYEDRFSQTLASFASDGFTHGIFGDIDFDRNRLWAEHICENAHLSALEPLWGEDRLTLLEEFLQLGFKAAIVAVTDRYLPSELLGRDLDWGVLDEIQGLGSDPSGENGEYHTVVYDGPLFSKPLNLEAGRIVARDGCHALDYRLAAD